MEIGRVLMKISWIADNNRSETYRLFGITQSAACRGCEQRQSIVAEMSLEFLELIK